MYFVALLLTYTLNSVEISLEQYIDNFLADHTGLLASFCGPSVRPSVCLSLSVTPCIVSLRVRVYRAESYTSVFLAGKFLVVCDNHVHNNVFFFRLIICMVLR